MLNVHLKWKKKKKKPNVKAVGGKMIITISSLSCPQSSLKIVEAGIWWA